MSGFPRALQNEILAAVSGDEKLADLPVYAERTDAQLVEAALAGDDAAFEQIFDRHKRFVAFMAARYFRDPAEVEEMVQVAFIKAFAELGAFRGRYGASLPSWLGRIASNACIDHLRSRRRRPEHLCSDLSGDDVGSLLSIADRRALCSEKGVMDRDLADKLLAGLPPDDRALLHMLYVDEMLVAEIASALGWSVSKVKVRAWRARRRLRFILKRFL